MKLCWNGGLGAFLRITFSVPYLNSSRGVIRAVFYGIMWKILCDVPSYSKMNSTRLAWMCRKAQRVNTWGKYCSFRSFFIVNF